jgi:hypothetical protein
MMISRWISCFVFSSCIFLSQGFSQSQSRAGNPAQPAVCPVEVLSFNPAGVTVHIRNSSGKTIVGLVFNAAISDATEHWKWLHWGFDQNRPLRDFGWNKAIKAGASKRLVWGIADLDFEHSGGGAFVLTSVLFSDGSSWEEPPDDASCTSFWYKHKKSSFRPVELPLRQ